MLDCQHNKEWHNVFSWQTGKNKNGRKKKQKKQN